MNTAILPMLVAASLGVQPPAEDSLRLPTYSLEVVAVNGEPLPGGPTQRVRALPGEILRAELYARDWSPFGEHLVGAQGQLDAASYYSGKKGSVAPVNFEERMNNQEDNGESFFIDVSHPRYVHKNREVLPITDTRSPEGYRWLSIQIRPPGPLSKQDGEKFYVGTVDLKVSDNAEGVFKIRLRFEDQGTIMIHDPGAPIEPVEAEILVVDVVRPVSREDVHALIDRLNGSDVATAPNPTDGLTPITEVIASLNLTLQRRLSAEGSSER